jgi:hypothetical protein
MPGPSHVSRHIWIARIALEHSFGISRGWRDQYEPIRFELKRRLHKPLLKQHLRSFSGPTPSISGGAQGRPLHAVVRPTPGTKAIKVRSTT